MTSSKTKLKAAGNRRRKSRTIGGRRALPDLVNLYLKISRDDLAKAGFTVEGRTPNPVAAEEVVVGAAFHEAAHAVMLRLTTGRFPVVVSIESGSDRLNQPGWGFTRLRGTMVTNLSEAQWSELLKNSPPKMAGAVRQLAECEALVYLAGPASDAARRVLGDDRSLVERIEGEPDDGDFQQAFAILRKFERDKRRLWKWIQRLAHKTEVIIRRPDIGAAIALFAEGLLDKPTLEFDDLAALLRAVPAEGHLFLANLVNEP